MTAKRGRCRLDWEGNLLPPSAVRKRRDVLTSSQRQPILQRAPLSAAASVRKTGVMTSNRVGDQATETTIVLDSDLRTSGRMINPSSLTAQAKLKVTAVFTEIVQLACDRPKILGAELRRTGSRLIPNRSQMIFEAVPRMLGNAFMGVSKKSRYLAAESSKPNPTEAFYPRDTIAHTCELVHWRQTRPAMLWASATLRIETEVG